MQRLAVVDLNTSRLNPRIVPGLPGERGTHGCRSNMSRAFLFVNLLLSLFCVLLVLFFLKASVIAAAVIVGRSP